METMTWSHDLKLYKIVCACKINTARVIMQNILHQLLREMEAKSQKQKYTFKIKKYFKGK